MINYGIFKIRKTSNLNKLSLSFRTLYTFAFIIIAVSLPLSKFLTSIGIFLLAAVWLAEGQFARKLEMGKNAKNLWVFLSIYLIHIIWLIFSTDYKYGLHDMQMKLPLLVLPIMMTTIKPIDEKHKRYLFGFFILALMAIAIIGTFVLLGYGKKPVTDAREISVFISHIRLSLMMNLGIFIAIWMLLHKDGRLFKHENIALIVIIILLSSFLFLLKSLTGIVVFIFLIVFSLIWIARRIRNRGVRYLIATIITSIILLIILYVALCFSRFNNIEKTDFSNLEKKTVSGHLYMHDTLNKNTENGHYVWIFICEDELKKTWDQRSKFEYSGVDKKGQGIKYTIIRYLTSRGLRKDSVGVSLLTGKDISLIESGVANYIYGNKWEMYPYIYRVFWEIDTYNKGENPAGHSVAQRWIYLNIAKEIIHGHFWLGIGTGDVQKEFNKVYESQYKNIPEHWRRRAHNQFLTFWVSFGIIGLVLILIAFFIPVLKRINASGYLGYIFILIAVLSMLNEDTLETQAGATFIAFFYSLFFLMSVSNEKSADNI